MNNQTTNYELRTTKKSPKVALVADWIIGGGAENVVYELHKIYPDAPIYTSYCSPKWRNKLHPARVITGYLQYWPFSKLRKYIFFFRAVWFSRLKLKGYDVVISVTGAEAKSVNVPNGVHISYSNVTHYYWNKYDEYLVNPGFGRFNWLARIGLKLFLRPMRKWDHHAAQLPDILIANSNHTKEQIQKYYQRESSVIHPPVETKKFARFAMPQNRRSGFTTIGRLTHWKRIDLAVEAFSKLGLPLKILGDGPERDNLESIASSNITFSGWVDGSKKLAEIIGSSEAFIFPGTDDFGIVSIEALSAGTPVIAYKDGGALDYIKPGINGEFFEPQTAEALAKTISKFNTGKYTQDDIKNSAEGFSIQTFRRKIIRLVDSL